MRRIRRFVNSLSHFPIRPRYQITERGPAIVAPGERRVLHLAERTDARGSPARQLSSQLLRLVFRSREAHGGDLAADVIGVLQGLGEVLYGFNIDEPVEAGELEAWVGFIHNRPGGGIAADPLPGIGR